MKILFFTGKGGVGKSTNASLFAYRLARTGKRVVLNSIDPAHNLHDIFQTKLSEKPRTIIPGLEVGETNLATWVKKYLKDTEDSFKTVYKYQAAFSLEKYFKTLKYSPGLEEYAVLLALTDVIERNRDKDYIVFDTPPTALTLKFLALPNVSLLWLRELAKFRQIILDKKEIITRVQSGRKKEFVQKDAILRKLDELIETYANLVNLFADKNKTSVVMVLNPDTLSLAESQLEVGLGKTIEAGLIWTELRNLNMAIPLVIINKDRNDEDFVRLVKIQFKGAEILRIGCQQNEVTGTRALEAVDLALDIDTL